MRHLYASASEPGMSFVIDKAKLFERRRCDHRPEEYPQPLSAVECLSSVVDPKGSRTNKHRYVVACQDLDVRKAMRGVMGVPLVYINRSVMIMEPMAGATLQNREKEEREKFRAGIKSRVSGSQGMKRKRDVEGEGKGDTDTGDGAAKRKRTHGKGPKGPNPLSVKKSKKRVDVGDVNTTPKAESENRSGRADKTRGEEGALEGNAKRKRRRKHKSGGGEGGVAATADRDAESVVD